MRRITITYNIDPLDQAETCEYIRHRLKIAGAGYDIFSSAAMEAVFEFSKGYPRQINIICDLAMFFSSQVSRRTISRKIVNQCRERISFTVDELPAETNHRHRVPAPKTHYQPIKRERWPWFTATRALGAALVLLVLGSGVYFTPDPLKDRARRWVRETYQTYFPVSGKPSATEQPVVNASTSVNAEVATVVPDASHQAVKTPLAVERLLRMPNRPPDLDLPEVIGDLPRASAADAQSASNDEAPAAAVTTSAAEPPDPADAIDWLLNKRKQELSQ
jgi:hypothetical protein